MSGRETAPGPIKTGSALGCPGSAPRHSRRRRGPGLRSQLLSTALLAAGLPILLTGGLAACFLAYPPEIAATGPGAGRDAPAGDAVRTGSAVPGTEAASGLDGFLVARIAEARAWASTPAIVEAARAAPPAPGAGAEPAALARAPVGWAGPGPARIVNASAGADDRNGLPFRAGPGPEPAQFPRDAEPLEGNAPNAGSLASVLDRLGLGRDIVRLVPAEIPDPAVLSAVIGDALSDRRAQLALALGAIALLSALFAAILASAAARRYAAALRAVTEMAERAAGGERARMPVIEGPREIARLGDAVDRLARHCNRVREPRPVGGAHAR